MWESHWSSGHWVACEPTEREANAIVSTEEWDGSEAVCSSFIHLHIDHQRNDMHYTRHWGYCEMKSTACLLGFTGSGRIRNENQTVTE